MDLLDPDSLFEVIARIHTAVDEVSLHLVSSLDLNSFLVESIKVCSEGPSAPWTMASKDASDLGYRRDVVKWLKDRIFISPHECMELGEVLVACHDAFPKGYRKKATLGGSSDYKVVHDSLDVKDVSVWVSGSIIGI